MVESNASAVSTNNRDLDPSEKGGVRPEPNAELEKVQIGHVLKIVT